jgi:RNA polymerase sigma-70 factor (ECF subfamily)
VPDWNQILDDFGPVVWKQAMRMLGNESDAADCFQSVMLEAFQLSQRRQVSSWPGLLKRLATVRAIDSLRARYRHSAQTLSHENLEQLQVSAQQTKALDEKELADELRRELGLLPKEQAEAFSLKVIQEMSATSVAEQMGITRNHVGVLVHRARTTIRKRLGRDEE